jgi:hypothetical protein
LPPNFKPSAILLPQTQTPPARAGTGIFVGQVLPTRTGPEYPEDAFQNEPIISPRPTLADAFRQQRRDLDPLFIGEKYVSHPQLFTYSFENSAKKTKNRASGTYETASNRRDSPSGDSIPGECATK